MYGKFYDRDKTTSIIYVSDKNRCNCRPVIFYMQLMFINEMQIIVIAIRRLLSYLRLEMQLDLA